ncbi:hypothetical protein ACWDRM_14070, partial [Streptomyces cellulosae]
AIGYDAVALGNHEFNYGIETLRKFEDTPRRPAALSVAPDSLHKQVIEQGGDACAYWGWTRG